MKVTNNLLAAVLILTVVPPYAGFSEAALEYCCSLISEKLLEKEVWILSSYIEVCLTDHLGIANRSSLHKDHRHGRCFWKCHAEILYQVALPGNDRVYSLCRCPRR